ncbi:MAG: hypothetical protein QGI86_00305 [Candidatus Poribacteria bacterium]|nr:hypothetical protein [Candidatus Poribacteria bacterium]
MKRWIATTENEWGSLSHKYIPRQLALRGKKVLEGYDCGDSSPYNFNYIENLIELATQPTASICTVIPYEQTNPNPFETKVTESENWSYNLLNLPPQSPGQSCIGVTTPIGRTSVLKSKTVYPTSYTSMG